jgi:spermidine synthase
MRGPDGERAIGRVYAVNTLGSIVGVIIAGLILMPVLGLKRLLVSGACIDIALGIWLTVVVLKARRRAEDAVPGRSRARTRRLAGDELATLTLPLVATLVLLVAASLAARFDLARITSGVYRHGVVPHSADYQFPFYRDGRTATVSLRTSEDGFRTISTNGKPDASMDRVWVDSTIAPAIRELTLTRDISTQFLLPIITLAHAPRAEHMAVIGHGSGMSSHVLLGSPIVRDVTTCEIEPEMIRASRGFYPANRRVFEDPRSHEVIDDAKSYFASSGRKFDLIMSEPSNPWVSGVSGLFTREFYARVRRTLAPGGVFGQWLHLYELNDQLVTSVLLAIDDEFADWDVYFTSNSDILIVASNAPLRTPDWSVVNYPGIAHDLRHALPLTPETFQSLHLGGRAVLHPMLLAWPQGYPNSDYFPILDLGAEKLRFVRSAADGYESLSEGRFDIVSALTDRRVDFGTVAYSPTPEVPRANSRALAYRMRSTLAMGSRETRPLDDDLRKALYRTEALDVMLNAPRAPYDWHQWVSDVVDVDADRHGGTAGVIDTAFFLKLRSFVARPGTPPEAKATVSFLHGIGSWNWVEAAAAGDTLLHSQDANEWLPDTLLYDGAIVAHVKLGQFEQAKEILRIFARKGREQQFQERLIAAFLAYSDPVTRKKLNWR